MVLARLRELAMPHAEVVVTVGEHDDDHPGDRVQFLLSANPGSPLLPLTKVASGGELARAMLALRLVLTGVDDDAGRTLVFDEVDAGIGGAAASAVAAALAEVAASHPKQPLGALARVASGGELSRLALAISVVASDVDTVPTLIFDEVDAGIGGTVAATVGRLLQTLARERQVLCVTHLPQVAAYAARHLRVTKHGDDAAVRTEVPLLHGADRVEELARMHAGEAITARTRAHAKELLAQARRA